MIKSGQTQKSLTIWDHFIFLKTNEAHCMLFSATIYKDNPRSLRKLLTCVQAISEKHWSLKFIFRFNMKSCKTINCLLHGPFLHILEYKGTCKYLQIQVLRVLRV